LRGAPTVNVNVAPSFEVEKDEGPLPPDENVGVEKSVERPVVPPESLLTMIVQSITSRACT